MKVAAAMLFGFAWTAIATLGLLQLAGVLPLKLLCVGFLHVGLPKGFFR